MKQKKIFEGTNISITTGGGRYLGADLGAAEFKEECQGNGVQVVW